MVNAHIKLKDIKDLSPKKKKIKKKLINKKIKAKDLIFNEL